MRSSEIDKPRPCGGVFFAMRGAKGPASWSRSNLCTQRMEIQTYQDECGVGPSRAVLKMDSCPINGCYTGTKG